MTKRDLVDRFSVSLPRSLARDLDRMVEERGLASRSRAIAALVRAELVEHRQRPDDAEITGTITLVYDHHRPRLQGLLTGIQHDHHHEILSTLHVHLDHDHCLEVLVVRGRAGAIRAIADALFAARGVTHGKLTVTGTGGR